MGEGRKIEEGEGAESGGGRLTTVLEMHPKQVTSSYACVQFGAFCINFEFLQFATLIAQEETTVPLSSNINKDVKALRLDHGYEVSFNMHIGVVITEL